MDDGSHGGSQEAFPEILLHMADERAVQLDFIQRQIFEVAEGRKACAEVVQREADPRVLNLPEDGYPVFRLAHEGSLCNLQGQSFRGYLMTVQDSLKLLCAFYRTAVL